MKEITHLRKPREKHFLNEDGTFTVYAYDHDIHYLKNGVFVEKDNTIIEKENVLSNKENDTKMQFAKDVTNDFLIKMEKERKSISLDIQKKKIEKEIKNNQITYKDILKNIDIHYDILDNTIKDTIILKEKENNFEDLVYTIETDLNLKLESNGNITASENDQIIFTLAKPTLQDKDNNFYPISYQLKDKHLSFIVDKKILEKEELYPLTIDPSLEANEDNSIFDTYIYPGDENTDRNNQDVLKVGTDENNITYRTLMKFNLPTIGTASEVINATVCLTSHKGNLPSGVEVSFKKINVHEVNTKWNEETANWNTMHDKYKGRIEDYFEPNRSYIKDGNTIVLQSSTFNITNLVKKWYAGTENNGILLKFGTENYLASDKEYWFYSKNNRATIEDKITNPKPYLIITYRNHNGLENYMSYQTLELNSGEIYINNLTGNVTSIFNINKTIAGKFPLQLNLIYNTNDRLGTDKFHLLKGFKWNYYGTIEESKKEGIVLEYTDTNGTIHYFKNKEEKIVDEDGLNLEATKSENTYTIKDKDKNKMLFTLKEDSYYLTKIINTANKEINIEYDENNQIKKLIDGNQEEINIAYETNKITVTSNYLTTHIQVEEDKIISIENKYGKTSLSYNEKNILSKITDTNGKKLEFSYYLTIPYRLKKVIEIGLNGKTGNELEFTYHANNTKIKDKKGNINSYTFNNLGNTIGITNLKSNHLNESYGMTKDYFTDTDKRKNKLKLETTPIKYTKNYLENTSFENGTYTNRTTECAKTGNYSLKINRFQAFNLPTPLDNGDYTFSAYFKTEKSATLALYYCDPEKMERTFREIEILPNNDFVRYSLPISISSELNQEYYVIRIISSEVDGILYMDDMQLEKGKIANYYNLIENSDFSKKSNNWFEFSYGIGEPGLPTINNSGPITLEDGITAYRLDSYAARVCEVDQTIAINGKEKDTYYLSFWYKNEGTYAKDGYSSKNKVEFSFEKRASDNSIERKTDYFNLNPNENEWQLFQKVIAANEEYDNINLKFSANYDMGDLYITNITLTKDVENTSYNYDEEGNLISVTNQNSGISEFKYDENNQLTKLFEPKGNSFSFEYDNKNTTQVLQGISKKGIANKIEYDENNNPIKTKIANNDTTELDGKSFYIRLKGTKKYLIPDYLTLSVTLKIPTCSNDCWDIKKEEENYHINSSVIPLYLSYNGTLSKQEGNSIHLIKNDNGSYTFKHSEEDLCLTVENNHFITKPYDKENDNQQFYLEPFDQKEYIETSAEYTSDGKFIKTTTDALGRVTEYDIDTTTGLINSITDPSGKTTNYTYNPKDQITKVEKENKETSYSYNDQDLLSKITCENKEYNFTYDDFLNSKEVKINNQTLVTNEYEENNGNLLSSTYGNHTSILYTYDELDRLKTLTQNNKTYTHIYDNQNHLAKLTEGNTTYNYYYDLAERLQNYEVETLIYDPIYDNGFTHKKEFTIDYSYDLNNNVTKKIYTHNGTKQQIEYSYDEDDSLVKVTLNDTNLNYIYDNLGRLNNKNINNQLPVSYTYKRNGNKTSLILNSMTIDNDIYNYQYDDLYNITDIYKNKQLQNHYEYDSMNELIKEDNYLTNKTITYTYDNSGNILKKQEYELNTENLILEDTYAYNNTNWGDQLTNYNNTTITYDAIGNPLTIGNANLTWNARELQTYQDTLSDCKYFYNKEGIRTKKIVNNVETNYFVENSNIIFEETNGNVLYYMRTGENDLLGFIYNNETYYYQKNYQGDITGIYNKDYELIATYEYDSWGKIISIKDNTGAFITDSNHIAIINPFRYRSYYYDSETNLYYLNSRYYNPEWGRFLNANGIIGTSETYLGYNLYTYCENNPIIYKDIEGNFLGIAIGATLALGVLALGAMYYGTKALQPIAGVITNAVENTITRKKERDKENAKVIENAQTKTTVAAIENYKNSQTPCTTAEIVHGDVKRGNRLTIQQSYQYVELGGNVMCDNQFYALEVAINFKQYIGPEIDKNRNHNDKYYYHYHPDRYSHRHIWFLGIPWSE